MAENGSGRLDDHEERMKKLEAARREVEDTLVVVAHLESEAGARLKEHAEWLVRQEASLGLHRVTMQEIDSKLNALIDFVGRMQGGIESRSRRNYQA